MHFLWDESQTSLDSCCRFNEVFFSSTDGFVRGGKGDRWMRAEIRFCGSHIQQSTFFHNSISRTHPYSSGEAASRHFGGPSVAVVSPLSNQTSIGSLISDDCFRNRSPCY